MSVHLSKVGPQYLQVSTDPLYNGPYVTMGWIRLDSVQFNSTAFCLFASVANYDWCFYNTAFAAYCVRDAIANVGGQAFGAGSLIHAGEWWFVAMQRHNIASLELFLGLTPATVASQAGAQTQDMTGRAAANTLRFGGDANSTGSVGNNIQGDMVGLKHLTGVDLTLAQLMAEAAASWPVTQGGLYYPVRFAGDYQNQSQPGTNDLTAVNGPLESRDDPTGILTEFFLPPLGDVAIGGWTAVNSAATDSFAGVAGTNIDAHTSDSGHSWTVPAMSPDPTPMQLTATGKLRPGAAQAFNTENVALLSYTPPSADYRVRATIRGPKTVPEVHEQDRALVLRASAAVATYYRADHEFFANRWFIAKKVADVETILATYSASYPAGTNVVAVFEARGSTLTLYLDGVLVMQVTDTDITQIGQAGLYNFVGSEVPADGTPDFDDFAVLVDTTTDLYAAVAEIDPAVDADYVSTGVAPVAEVLKLDLGWPANFGAGSVATVVRHLKQ